MSIAETESEPTHDPYTIRDGESLDPPASFRRRLRYLGPSVVIAGSIVGSGEIILTAGLGAAAGFGLLWWVLFACWIKSLIQSELARYIVVSGDTYLRALNRLPGKLPGPRGPVAWPIYMGLIAFIPNTMGLGGIVGGAGQSLNLLIPSLPSVPATALVALAASALLVTGSYRLLERTMLVLVMSFTAVTIVCAVMMQFTEYGITMADLASGFTFDFDYLFLYLAMALSVYGYTGVNSSETSAYTYWCVEKGYPSLIGPPEQSGWPQRALGWIRVLQTDVVATLLILTCATIPFYLLGAGVLHAMGQTPEKEQTITVLSNMFTETLGPWAVSLFGVGAFCILFSTTLAAIAGGARYIPDYLIELGFLDRHNVVTRRRIIRIYCGIAPVIAFVFYLTFKNPVLLVTIGAITASLFLPVQSAAVLWLQKHNMDQRVAPAAWVRAIIWLIFCIEFVLTFVVIWKVVLKM